MYIHIDLTSIKLDTRKQHGRKHNYILTVAVKDKMTIQST